MKCTLAILIFFCFSLSAFSQTTLKLVVRDAESKKPMAGASASLSNLDRTAIADSAGMIIFNDVAAGTYTVSISFVGFEQKEITVVLPSATEEPIEVLMEESEEEEEEIIVSATRTSRNINDIPTRVETISGEELEEKGNMKPGDIRMLLNESTGIQTQQTSATSYNSSIRIQGLDGRYTQILRDGIPMYAGFSGGLSLMQIAPLDLKQVEVIKGSSSTLYGGGAIAGLVNLVSKVPTDTREISFLANGTSARGFDLSSFYSEKFSNLGVTFFASANKGVAYDPANIGLTAIPAFERYTLNPRLFLYGKQTAANVGVSWITEGRTGGSMDYIKYGVPGYYEKNSTDRITGTMQVRHQLSEATSLDLKSSYSNFNRSVNIPSYLFEGVQNSSFSEVSLITKGDAVTWNAGVNFITDNFKEERHSATPLRDYTNNTFGGFVQNTWTPVDKFTLETGLRGDYVKQYGFELLPRFSAMLKATPQLTARLGGGLGYKTPGLFNEEAEKLHFSNILPISELRVANERSLGGNFDINYRTRIKQVGFTINQLFFYTKLNRPLQLMPAAGFNFEFLNAGGYIDTKGMETNVRMSYDDLKLFIGYTYADVNQHWAGTKTWFPLTAKHRLNNVLMYEKEGKLKVGLEAYYFSPQQLSDGSMGKSYWIGGLMAEKMTKHFSVFINFENFTDTRQTKFDRIHTGSIGNPQFRDIYAPVDGFVVNGGIKVRW